jgi:hypothetical protein
VYKRRRPLGAGVLYYTNTFILISVLRVMQISFTKRKVHLVYGILALVSLLLAGISSVRAQEITEPTTNPEGTRAGIEMRRAELSQEQQDRFINLVRNTESRMSGAITRLENIIVRLEARIAILKATGIRTEDAEETLAGAKDALAIAKNELKDAKTLAESGITSDTPRSQFESARTRFTSVRQSIRDAFILLREVVTELKDAILETELNTRGVSSGVQSSSSTEGDTRN